jgi:hypothetical protein
VTRATDIANDLSTMPPKHAPGREIGAGRAIMEAAMNYSYWRTERLIADAVDRRILRRTTVWDQIVSFFTNTDLLIVAAICIVGLLASLAAMLALPNFAEVTEALQQLL